MSRTHVVMMTLALAGIGCAGTAHGENISWCGAAGGAWSSAANWSGGKVPTAEDTVTLGSGAQSVVGTDTLRERGGVIDDWSVSGAWTLNGDTITKNAGFTENHAYVTNDNVLVLTDDAGGQRNYAFYQRNTIGGDETFEAQFDYRATLLGRHAGESRAEGFACVFAPYAGNYDWSHICAVAKDSYGFLVKVWGSGGFNWVYDQDVPSNVAVSGTEMGINFGKTVHITVRLVKGQLTVKMEQGATVWSATKDMSAGFANGRRRAFGFTGGTTANFPYYAYQTFANFVGRSTVMGGVVREGYLPFSANTWKTENRTWPTPLPMVIESESCVMMTNGVNSMGTIGCKKTIPIKEAFTFEFTERLSSVACWAEGMSISLNPTQANPTINGDRFTCNMAKSITFGHKWWENCFRWRNTEKGTVIDSAASPNGMARAVDADYRWYFSHDGCGTFTVRVSCGNVTYTDTQTFPDVLDWGEKMYLVFTFGSNWNSSIICRARNPRLGFTYDGPTALAGTLAVEANVAASLTVANLTADTAGAVATVPLLSLASGSSLAVAPSTAKGVRVTAETVATTGAATLSAAEGAVFELNRVALESPLTVSGAWSARNGVVTLQLTKARAIALASRLMTLPSATCADAALPTFALVDENGKPYSSRWKITYANDIVSLEVPGSLLFIK